MDGWHHQSQVSLILRRSGWRSVRNGPIHRFRANRRRHPLQSRRSVRWWPVRDRLSPCDLGRLAWSRADSHAVRPWSKGTFLAHAVGRGLFVAAGGHAVARSHPSQPEMSGSTPLGASRKASNRIPEGALSRTLHCRPRPAGLNAARPVAKGVTGETNGRTPT